MLRKTGLSFLWCPSYLKKAVAQPELPDYTICYNLMSFDLTTVSLNILMILEVLLIMGNFLRRNWFQEAKNIGFLLSFFLSLTYPL